MKKILSVLLLLCLLLPILPAAASARRGYDPIIRIGLQYDSGAMAAANLQNVTGMDEGYLLGYFDEDREFVPTYEILDENRITVLRHDQFWRTGDKYSLSEDTDCDEELGAYCLQINEYFDEDDALDLCEELRDDYDLEAYPCAVLEGYRVRIGNYTSERSARRQLEDIESDIDWELVLRGPSSTGYTVVATGTCDILFQFDMLGDYQLAISPHSEQTWFKGYKYYGSFCYYRADGGNMNVINYVHIEDYVKGVIPYEMSPSWPVEALKAQALCAKSYTLRSLGKHGNKGFDLCNTTDCQVYYGTNSSTEVTDEAVEDVRGLYVMYDGEVCQTYYHASSGGYTEDVENIWGKEIPYLKAVEDVYLESTRPFSHTLDLYDISWILQEKGYITQDVTDMYVSRYSDVGNVLALTVELEDGSVKTFTGDRARTALNSKTLGVTIGSHRYTINGGSTENSVCINGMPVGLEDLYAQGEGRKPKKIDMEDGLVALTANGVEEITITEPEKLDNDDGTYVITGTGSGHNIGLSQEGARSMANAGFDYEEIIEFYFTGVEVDDYDPD